MPELSPPLSAHPSRRAVVAGAVALGAASVCGCDVSTPDIHPPGSHRDADVPAATEVVRETRAMVHRIRRTVRRHPHLATPLAGTLRVHRAHLAALGHALPTDTAKPAPTDPVPGDPARALAALERAERRLHARLDVLARHARSGEFARLLASMGAAVSQRLSDWPKGPAKGSG